MLALANSLIIEDLRLSQIRREIKNQEHLEFIHNEERCINEAEIDEINFKISEISKKIIKSNKKQKEILEREKIKLDRQKFKLLSINFHHKKEANKSFQRASELQCAMMCY